MNSKDIFGLEYKVGSRRYILTKTDLRCIDQAKTKNNFSIPVNQIDPYYIYGYRIPIYALLIVGYLLLGVVLLGIHWLQGSPLFDIARNIQLIVFSLILGKIGYGFYRQNRDSACSYKFLYLHDGEAAFSIPANKKNKEETLAFVDAIVNRIHSATPANEHIVALLYQHRLLTLTEATQLDKSIHQKIPEVEVKTNIIHLGN